MNDRTLVTGFKAFGSIAENPSSKLAETCGRPFQTLEVAYRAVDDFLAGLDSGKFDRLLMIGVAAGRDRITPELLGRNFIGQTPDVRGFAPMGFIDASGPMLLPSTLWTPDVVSQIVIDVPQTKISMDAGKYVCNYISYRALQKFPDKKVGFLHVPPIEKLSLDVQQKCLEAILAIVERQ